MKTEIKKWYTEQYPTDDLAGEIEDNITFEDLHNSLRAKQDVYDLLGVVDSVIRERCFAELANILDVDYDYVYNLWLSAVNSDIRIFA